MFNFKKALIILLALTFLMMVTSNCSSSKKDFITIQIWHYYNGAQKIAFDDIVSEFNDNEGFEKGIYIEALNQGNIVNLEKEIQESMFSRVGSQDLPDIVIVYPDMALLMDDEGILVDQMEYLKDKDIGIYMDNYIDEGYLKENSSLKLFPIAKATEILMVNKTDWERFSKDTGASLDSLKTWEGITELSEIYYNWTKNLEENNNAGKSFFGRDAMANYMIIGAKQLGEEIFQMENGQVKININEDAMKRLWDNYYIPYVKGYFAAHGRFSSDDAKVGDIIALVGSTSGAAYFPDSVTIEENPPYKIESLMLPLPTFEGGKRVAIQQGAGAAVIKSNEKNEKAALEFLKYFTESSRNVEFSYITGYLPVTKESNNLEEYKEKIYKDEKSPIQLKEALLVAMEQMKDYEIHISRPFKNSIEARNCLSIALEEKAEEDRTRVVELMENGETHENAIKRVLDNEDFEAWIKGLEKDVENIVSEQY